MFFFPDSIVVQFMIRCSRIEDGASVSLYHFPVIRKQNQYLSDFSTYIFLLEFSKAIALQIGVIGSASQLGKWKTQDGLRLKYSGDNTWKAECVLRKYEFPLKYPFLWPSKFKL